MMCIWDDKILIVNDKYFFYLNNGIYWFFKYLNRFDFFSDFYRWDFNGL